LPVTVTSYTRTDLNAAQGQKKARLLNDSRAIHRIGWGAACPIVGSISRNVTPAYGMEGKQDNLNIAMVPIRFAYHAKPESRSVAHAY
jgi:hypothetical protein